MIRLNKPSFSQEEVLEACIHNLTKDKHLILENKLLLKELYENYESLAETNDLHCFIDSLKDEQYKNLEKTMLYLYTGKLSNKEHIARDFYDKLQNYTRYTKVPIVSRHPHQICPMCHTAEVDTLDHHLPKSEYPSLSINPLNLIPICGKCNKNKLSYTPSHKSQNPIHLYFDEIPNLTWLGCQIDIKYNPQFPIIDIEFSVNTNHSNISSETEELLLRVNNTFNLYKMNQTYGALASNQFMNIFYQIMEHFQSGGRDALKIYLQERYDDWRDKNTWEAAFYKNLMTGNGWSSLISTLNKLVSNNEVVHLI